MPLASENGWHPHEVFRLLEDERLSARAKLLVWFLAIWINGEQHRQEDLSRIVDGNSKSDTVRKAIQEAERYGYIDVDRSVKPHWYKSI
jgi:hypothetical protein